MPSETMTPNRLPSERPFPRRSSVLRTSACRGRPTPQCQVGYLDNGLRCTGSAVAYVEFHMIGHCRRADCDSAGNACGYVCVEHLEAMANTARNVLMEAGTSSQGPTSPGRCPTCGRTLLGLADILQAVVEL